MKKNIAIALIVVLVLSCAACGKSKTKQEDEFVNKIVTVMQQERNVAIGRTSAAETSSSSEEEIVLPESDVDIDLTLLSETMAYSEVFAMLSDPDEFLGKSVRMKGTFSVYEGSERNYFTCLITDATACCQQGIEFLWEGDHVYPDDYPEPGHDVTVTGVFHTYNEGETRYCELIDAQVEWSET